MDEQAVRGLMKEQFDGFTSQLAALTLELQTTKAELVGGISRGNDHGIPRSMRLDVPKFNGSNPDRWIFAINEYFYLLEKTTEQRLCIIGSNLEGDAAEWYRWMTRNKLITSWDGFLESVQNRFSPSKYEDPQGSDALAEEDEALESGDISILNSLVGHGSPRSLQLWGTVGAGEVHVLIDNGSTHNFVRLDVVELMCLLLTATKAFKVYIGSGESLLCESG
nr:hypothetical protein [Tanacetum cinerariifolium]GEY18675.1 hypothetical protein [Tanacetum cinerariifolium]